uniref:C-type mannose receptor 2 n=1 Tax=Magallana gigas TaxID=29159 RepID=K1R0A7_MAGGI
MAGTACPVGWTPYRDSCYHVSPENESWINAMKMCEVHGSYLADILDAEENRFIVSLMHHTQSNSFWIGGSDWTVEGEWVWEPLGIKFNYTNFADGRPNNYHAFGCLIGWTPFNTSCYHLSGESTSWMDAMKMCEMRGAYLVHVDAASEDDFITSLMKTNGVHNVWLGGSDWAVEGQWVWEPEGTPFQYSCFSSGKPDNKNAFGCHSGWTSFNTSCYHVSGEPTSWVDSMKMCEMRGAYLVHVDSASEDEFVTSLMKTHGVSDVWLGGSDWSSEGSWVWEPEGNIFQYSKFTPGQPNNHNGENCLMKEAHHHYYWNDKDCDLHRAYICEDP